VSDEETGESLAAAVADHASIDWRESERLNDADPDLVRQLKIISAIGERSRATVVADDSRSARALFGLSLAVAAITLAKLTLALVGLIIGWPLMASGYMPWTFGLNVALFGISGAVLVAGSTRDTRVQALGLLFIVIASAFTSPLMIILRDTPAPSQTPK